MENTGHALILAANFTSFIDEFAHTNTFSNDIVGILSRQTASALKSTVRSAALAEKSGDVSAELCVTGRASVEGDSESKFSIRYTDCDSGEVITNGTISYESTVRPALHVEVLETTTLSNLRMQTLDQSEDVIFDGTISVTISDLNYGLAGESGSISASLDVRDMHEMKGASLRNYSSRFTLEPGEFGGLVAIIEGRTGEIYDDKNEYFSLVADGPGDPGAFIKISNILEFEPLRQALHHMSSVRSVPVLMGLKGRDSSAYVYDDPSSDEAVIELFPPMEPTPITPDSGSDSVITSATQVHVIAMRKSLFARVALDQLEAGTRNDAVPLIDMPETDVHLRAGEYYVIPHLDFSDVDQQFVEIRWELQSKPLMSAPIYFSLEDGFLFTSFVSGEYLFRVEVNDGTFTAEQTFSISVSEGF